MSLDEALAIARQRFGPGLARVVRLERADFGWIARVEELDAGDGLIGHPVLAIGPNPDQARFYPAGPSAVVRRLHLGWLDTLARLPEDPAGPPSFSCSATVRDTGRRCSRSNVMAQRCHNQESTISLHCCDKVVEAME